MSYHKFIMHDIHTTTRNFWGGDIEVNVLPTPHFAGTCHPCPRGINANAYAYVTVFRFHAHADFETSTSECGWDTKAKKSHVLIQFDRRRHYTLLTCR